MKLRRAEALEEAVQRAQSLCKELRWKNFREVEPETLIHNRKGAPYTYDGFSTLWQKARARSGVEDARIHDIRAKAVTDAEELGMNAQMLAGHASRLTTERYLRGRKAFIADPLPALLRPRKKAKKSAKSAAPKASKAASKRRAGDGFRGIDSVAPRRRNLRQEPEY